MPISAIFDGEAKNRQAGASKAGTYSSLFQVAIYEHDGERVLSLQLIADFVSPVKRLNKVKPITYCDLGTMFQ